MGTYLIQYAQDKNYVLGVTDEMSGAKVVLRKAEGTPYRYVLWDIDQDTGIITLNSSGGELAIDPQGGNVDGGVFLTLAVVNSASKSQRFDMDTKPRYILSASNPKYCIDNESRQTQDGNPIWLYEFNGSQAQQWIAQRLSFA
ncbi:RICIN domain-containing protein [Pseudomonas aeruginosa]|uniref:RICIN domain-containing protein n=1 Tax=Pseudomonas aeruginosa TaxID=287 RepID=UPI0003B96503|nr:RICIN domain-containing protein [Pseudomonas aeruginosa]EIU7173742.1 RICIN domain-containing protein [Pseudomonas aeruginosa]EJB8525895.1 RICIN domain-containing protein [Pseudomonas aeruginosa]EKX2036728.1 RICIN domain-containing protein [Pseudomonas aeruginosa]ELF7083962.1 RICIN domain-containing protein [Pseudomonas aeruginosa]ELF7095617.1 RICIN domain-containing protein [Pseudomonas aeruginosa]